jgi:hypothetical protein
VGTSRAPGSKVIIAARLRLSIGSCATSVCRMVELNDAWETSTNGI